MNAAPTGDRALGAGSPQGRRAIPAAPEQREAQGLPAEQEAPLPVEPRGAQEEPQVAAQGSRTGSRATALLPR